MKKYPGFIQTLVDKGDLKLSVDENLSVDWPYTKIAGPCSVEGGPGDKYDIVEIAKNMKKLGANAFRAGAYKPCTYPITKFNSKDPVYNGWKEGLREEGLQLLKLVKEETGLPIVTEIMHNSQLTDETLEIVDVVQVGTRNAQN